MDDSSSLNITRKSSFRCPNCALKFSRKKCYIEHLEFHLKNRQKKSLKSSSDFQCQICRHKFYSLWECLQHIKSEHKNYDNSQVVASNSDWQTQNLPVNKKILDAKSKSGIMKNSQGSSKSWSEDNGRINQTSKQSKCVQEMLNNGSKSNKVVILSSKQSKRLQEILSSGSNVCLTNAASSSVNNFEKHCDLFVCDHCRATFICKYDLRYHIKRMHSDRVLIHNCAFCNGKFRSKRMLNKHQKTEHNNGLKKLTCSICSVNLRTKSNYRNHCNSEHNIATEEYSFSCINEFNIWKRTEENAVHCKYVTQYTKTKNDTQFKTLICNRSLSYRSASKHHRKLESSNEDGNCECSSHMELRIEMKTGHVNVQYFPHHSGHENNNTRPLLSDNSIAEFIYDELMKKSPIEKIVENVCLSNNEEWITKTDVYDIVEEYKKLRVNKYHSLARKIKESDITQQNVAVWNISSQSSISPANRPKLYQVQLKATMCDDCKMQCSYCGSCSHMYSCQCDNYNRRNLLCEHVHAVCMFRKTKTSELEDSQLQLAFNLIEEVEICDDSIITDELESLLEHKSAVVSRHSEKNESVTFSTPASDEPSESPLNASLSVSCSSTPAAQNSSPEVMITDRCNGDVVEQNATETADTVIANIDDDGGASSLKEIGNLASLIQKYLPEAGDRLSSQDFQSIIEHLSEALAILQSSDSHLEMN